MGIFSRIGDILGSNINAMLEKAEDPEKIARLIIQEMEDTLVEVRTSAARSIADKKELTRRVETARSSIAEWEEKAELAIEKDREDLARGALAAKQKNLRKAEILEKELAIVEEAIEKANSDMGKLQVKLEEAKTKHKALALRRQTAEDRIRVRERVADTKIDDALARYELVERKVDEIEAQAEAFDLGRGMSLEGKFAELEAEEAVEADLAALKQRLRGGAPARPRLNNDSDQD
ncbi:MAG: phage shock protein PspA [Caulobacterales bacterium]|nr:phage shock protein PspA [Caulobacterales bacterium]